MYLCNLPLVSLMHIIEQIQHHPRPPISLDEEQELKRCSPESRIAEAAYVVEDVIESRIVDQILDGSTERVVGISSSELHNDLQKMIEDSRHGIYHHRGGGDQKEERDP
ncbi:hypothetical protein ACS0TY_011958 [Phlomoides rotata]